MTRTPDPRITKSSQADRSNPVTVWVWRAPGGFESRPTHPLPSLDGGGVSNAPELRRLPVGASINPTCAIPANAIEGGASRWRIGGVPQSALDHLRHPTGPPFWAVVVAFHPNQSIRWDQLASQFVPERIETTAVLAPFSGP